MNLLLSAVCLLPTTSMFPEGKTFTNRSQGRLAGDFHFVPCQHPFHSAMEYRAAYLPSLDRGNLICLMSPKGGDIFCLRFLLLLYHCFSSKQIIHSQSCSSLWRSAFHKMFFFFYNLHLIIMHQGGGIQYKICKILFKKTFLCSNKFGRHCLIRPSWRFITCVDKQIKDSYKSSDKETSLFV